MRVSATQITCEECAVEKVNDHCAAFLERPIPAVHRDIVGPFARLRHAIFGEQVLVSRHLGSWRGGCE